MSNLLKSKFFLGGLIAVAFVFAGAQFAHASYTNTSLLKMGMSNSAVMSLQQTLNGGGFLVSTTGAGSPGMESSYFGAKTKAAVMAFQAAKGLTVDGVVGAQSNAALAAMTSTMGTYPAGCSSSTGFSTTTGMSCSSTTTYPAGCTSAMGFSPTTGMSCAGTTTTTTTGGPLMGTDGSISGLTQLSQYSGEEVGEGSSDVKVLGVEIEASNDGDIALKSMKVSAAITNGSGSRRFEDYIKTVTIWQGTTKVGSADAMDFNKDSTGNYSKTITLSNSVVKADDKESFYITFDGNSSLDSGDIDSEVMTIGIDSVRFEDGSGVVTTDSTVGVLPLSGVSVKIVSLSTAANTELKISTNSTPVAGVVEVSDSSDTEGVVLLKGKLKLEGTSDVWLDELPITLTAGTTLGSISAITGSVTLTIDGQTFTESTGTNCVDETDFSTAQTCSTEANETAGILFDNLDLTLTAGDTINFTVTADINDLDATVGESTNFDAGDTLLASLTAAGRAFIVAENDAGDQLTDSTEMSGSATGNAQSFYSEGILVDLVSKTATKTTSSDPATTADSGTYVINFDVTAVGADMYIDKSSVAETVAGTADTTAGQGVEYYVSKNGTAVSAGATKHTAPSSIVSADGSTTDDTATAFKVIEGETRHFHVTVNFGLDFSGADAAGFYRVNLGSVNWDNESGDATPDFFYTFDLGDYQTPDLSLDDYSL